MNLQVSVPCVTPVQGRLGGTSRKEALTRLCGSVCITSYALPLVFSFSQPSLILFVWLGFFFFILGYLKTLDILSKYESKRMGHLD